MMENLNMYWYDSEGDWGTKIERAIMYYEDKYSVKAKRVFVPRGIISKHDLKVKGIELDEWDIPANHLVVSNNGRRSDEEE
jgi:hypothetical protein